MSTVVKYLYLVALTSSRRYSFCSCVSRLRMTPAVARVRTPTWTLMCLAGSDHSSWKWTWLRPSKENSGATCQSRKTKETRVQLIQPALAEIRQDITAGDVLF